MNLVRATIDDGRIRVGEAMFPLPAHLAPFAPRGRQEVLLGIRPEDLTIAPHETPGSLAGEVALVEHIGSESLIAVRPKHAETAHVAEEEDQEQTGVMGDDARLQRAQGRRSRRRRDHTSQMRCCFLRRPQSGSRPRKFSSRSGRSLTTPEQNPFKMIQPRLCHPGAAKQSPGSINATMQAARTVPRRRCSWVPGSASRPRNDSA